MAGQGDLGAGVAAFRDVGPDQRVKVVERPGGEAERREVGFGKWVAVGHGGLLS